jgi:hypothetical protein
MESNQKEAIIAILQQEILRQLPLMLPFVNVGDAIMAAECRGRIDGLKIAIDLIKKP